MLRTLSVIRHPKGRLITTAVVHWHCVCEPARRPRNGTRQGVVPASHRFVRAQSYIFICFYFLLGLHRRRHSHNTAAGVDFAVHRRAMLEPQHSIHLISISRVDSLKSHADAFRLGSDREIERIVCCRQ